jgi:hypothetical protein
MLVVQADSAGVQRGIVSESKLERTVAQVYDAIGALCPGKRFTFQLAKYSAGHFIEPHDDTAYVELEDSPGAQWTRDIAVVYVTLQCYACHCFHVAMVFSLYC